MFLDVVSLRAGEWRPQLEAQIASSDALLLFWSRAASQSEEVAKEWKYALSLRGVRFIRPVPLESPEVAPPPPELSRLHFGQLFLLLQSIGER